MSPPPADPDAPAAEILDGGVLDELRLVGGDKLVRELMAVFAERTPERLRSAERALAAGDLEALAAAVHSLRSAAGTIGARGLAELAGRMEGAARGRGSDDPAAGLTRLREETERVLAAAGRLA